MARRTLYKIPFMKAILSVPLFILMLTGTESLVAQVATNHRPGAKATANTVDIVRNPEDVPPLIANRAPTVVHVMLTAEEVLGQLDPTSGTTYRYWTFNGKVPGPMIRVEQGDSVEVTLHNDAGSHMVHSVDFHAALGPGGGAAFSQAIPGQSKTFTFQATTPGLFVYHCGTPMIAEHIANGMYGLILVEPQGGLPHVDHEYYVMQGEIYTSAPKGKAGLQQFSDAKLIGESPEYFVFNGAVDALTKEYPMHANVGETVRVFFGDAGPNDTSSLHVVGEIFTRDYALGSLTSPPLTGIQTASVPPGGAAVLEFKASVPGQFTMMDHAMARMAKGLMAVFDVSGPQNAALMHAGPALSDPPLKESAAWVTGMTRADTAAGQGKGGVDSASAVDLSSSPTNGREEAIPSPMRGMAMDVTNVQAGRGHGSQPMPVASRSQPSILGSVQLNGCLTFLSDGRVMLKALPSAKTYRMEGILFSEYANRLVHVSGYFGSVVSVEDSGIPSFVVHTVDQLAPNCAVKITAAMIRKARPKPATAEKGTVNMSDMAFLPATITVNVGQNVVWKNSSQVIHNVVDDANKALHMADVKLPSSVKPFDSNFLQPGQTFARIFTVPGVYRYVCTLHEANGMKGVVIVRPSPLLAARKSPDGM
ncbi:MAG: nitrite reductase, copper-containing [Acidobacteriia bacterium]|nr:nitrite reductase, copper-containing [Terriglobia bacterium]